MKLINNVESGPGWVTNARGYLKAKIRPHRRALVTENPLFVRAAREERVDADTYKVKVARLSSCTSEAKGRTVGARSGRVGLGDKLVVHQADLRFLEVPVFYAPILVRCRAALKSVLAYFRCRQGRRKRWDLSDNRTFGYLLAIKGRADQLACL